MFRRWRESWLPTSETPSYDACFGKKDERSYDRQMSKSWIEADFYWMYGWKFHISYRRRINRMHYQLIMSREMGGECWIAS